MLESLSPPRRRLVLTMAALVAIAVLALALLVGVRAFGSDDGSLGAGPSVDVQQDEPGPVLLVPGYGGGTDGFGPLQSALEAAGREVRVLDLPGNGEGDMRAQAKALASAVDDVLRSSGASSVDIVGYSAGGVVARLWAQELGGSEQARRIMTLGSPHHGTQLAALAERLAPSECPEACQQLVPGSDLLDSINRDETPAGPAYIALWTTQDQTVTPPESGRLDGATNIELQSVCGDSRVSHGGLPKDALVIGLILSELSGDPVSAPAASDCSDLRAAGSA
ncbi:MAG: estB [Pseudonocardiales bacterium]|nr:estB [Pseudonocardiales bacterium]